ncbi:hypothetical protein BpHYR1_030417 [Brachionus plicatilis]|uniref:Uncharacterized protein n=1 Tax=Brachionus plicatilis TaxID=10195 RepID=A0A3M7SLU0_BRAPC|nr:hypothetical protein BpHYR1_030417 [Brachionus plicatilis]
MSLCDVFALNVNQRLGVAAMDITWLNSLHPAGLKALTRALYTQLAISPLTWQMDSWPRYTSLKWPSLVPSSISSTNVWVVCLAAFCFHDKIMDESLMQLVHSSGTKFGVKGTLSCL